MALVPLFEEAWHIGLIRGLTMEIGDKSHMSNLSYFHGLHVTKSVDRNQALKRLE